jgi:putative membrane protein
MANLWLQGWEGAGPGWTHWLDDLGAIGLLGVYAGLVAHALLTRRRERIEGALGEEDLAALHRELGVAERRTVGEILPVVVERSDHYPGASWFAGTVFMIGGTILLGGRLPWDHPAWLLLVQLALLGVGYATARFLPGFQRVFLRPTRAAEMVAEQALQEFQRHGLHETEARTGVLLFVSLLERRAVVLADKGIDAEVEPEQWTRTTRAVLEGIRGDSLRAGLEAGIRSAADVLEKHFPWKEGDRNEIPDRIVLRKE